MCLIFTAVAAAVFGVLYFVSNKRRGQGYKSLATAALICTAAALMWCVDGFAAIAAGELPLPSLPFSFSSKRETKKGTIGVRTEKSVRNNRRKNKWKKFCIY